MYFHYLFFGLLSVGNFLLIVFLIAVFYEVPQLIMDVVLYK